MTQKIAVAVLHGIGKQTPDFAEEVIEALNARCYAHCGNDIIIQPVYWAPVMDYDEKELWTRAQKGGALRYETSRRFLIDFLGDAFAYQIADTDRHVYDQVHRVFAESLYALAQAAGENAPLCVIAHSLGTVIASNFIYDLQAPPEKNLIAPTVRAVMGGTALERGETLALLYTLGSPLAIWSLRYNDFGTPVSIPDPHLSAHYPQIVGEWVNYYDADDVIGFPLKTLNDAYGQQVTADRQINAGKVWYAWSPFSHLGYWMDKDVLDPIAAKLIEVWQAINAPAS